MSEQGANGGGGGAVLDTSWINNEPAAGGSGGATTSRGRGGSKRRTRRRTLSPSIGEHNYMSNVDFNDPMNFPSLPSSGGSKNPSSSSNSSSGGGADAPADDVVEGLACLMAAPHPSPTSPPREGAAAARTGDQASFAAGCSTSPSHSSAGGSEDADMPDPTVVAGLFDIEGVPTPPPPGPLPLGTLGALGNLEIVKASSSDTRKKEGEAQEFSGKKPRASTARGRSNRRATFGGADARVFLEVENLEPVLPSKPPARAAVDAAAAVAATRASPTTTTTTAEVQVVAGQQQQAPDLASAPATAPHGSGEGGNSIHSQQPPAAKQKSRSRSSRRRSIVMPSEAQPLMDSDLDDGRAEATVAPAPAPASPTTSSKGGGSAAGKEIPAVASSNGKSIPGGSSKNSSSSKRTTASDEFPLSSVNATSCLSRSLAAQRGWALGDQDTRKQLFRAYYAAAPGSQRARRIAARLFCLTGYALSPVAPEDARVLCAAAGDGMDWGLDETEPRLVSQPIIRETKEQKRVLVLRIKPLFDLMEKASSEEKLKAEAATGVVSRKASPDGYRYEDRESGKPVDPDAYKVPYLEHVRAVRASRVREFAARRATAPPAAPALLPEAVCGSTAEAGVIASVDNGTAVSPAAVMREVGEARLEDVVLTAAPAIDADLATGAADVVVAKESPKEGGRLPDDVSPPVEVLAAEIGNDDALLEEADAAATAAEEDKVVAGSNTVEAENGDACVVEEAKPPAVLTEDGPRAPATTATAVAWDEGSPRAAATRVAAVETPIAVEQDSVLTAGTAGETDTAEEKTACAESETLIAVAPASLMAGGVEDDGEEEDAAAAEDPEAHGEMLRDSPAVVARDEVETPCLSPAADDACTPGAAASAASEPGSARPEEPDEIHGRSDAAATTVSPVSLVDQETPNGGGPEVSGGGDGISSSRLSEVPSPVLADDGGIVSPITGSPACAESMQDEACGDDASITFGGQGHGLERFGGSEAVAPGGSSPSTRKFGPSPRGSTEHDERDGGSAAAASSLFSASPAASVAAAASASPLVTAGGYSQQPAGLLSGRTPEPDQRVHQEFTSRERPTPPCRFSNAGSPAMSDTSASSAEDEEGAEEIGALKERLWAAWDAAVLEYEKGVALVRSRYNRQALSTTPPVASITTAPEGSAAVSRLSAGAADPTPTAKVAETSSQEGRGPTSGSEAATTPVPSAANAVETVAEEPAAVVVAVPTATDGMPTPDSPLLPLLQLRLEEEEGDLFEYHPSWCGSGAGGEGSSQARGGKTRRRSLAKAFSSQKTRKGPKVQEAVLTAGKSQQGAAEEAAAQETDKSETGGSEGGDRTAVLCKLCCRKACDTVLRPCEHTACGVCVEKIRLQAEQSGRPLSCPWDRKLVDYTRPL